MSDAGSAAASPTPSVTTNEPDKALFWGCFIALITTAFGFITRMFLLGEWETEFGLDKAQVGRLAGIGIWPFAVSIIGFSLFIDKIGYKIAMIMAFLGHVIWACMGVGAYMLSTGDNPDKETAFALLYWGSLVLGLANGTVEAFINPVVATMFNREKTKWLNILHAGWPGGLVVAGIIVIFMGDLEWGYKVGIIAAPALVYFLMLIPREFPAQERVASGVTYRDMLAEFGILGAMVVGFLVTLQLIDFATVGGTVEVDDSLKYGFVGIGVAIVVGFGLYTRAIGRLLLFFLVLIMMPLATTEIGTDGWITGIMEGTFEMSAADVEAAGGIDNVLTINGKPYSMHPGWVLIYTSAIMMVLRFFAGPIVHTLSPLGLLCGSCVLAIAGLYWLSIAEAAIIFAAATLYAFGKTFFWPTMLGVVAEQTPRGGALTLNAISGIGMLAVGTLGFPYIGALQAENQIEAVSSSEVAKEVPGLVEDGKLTTTSEGSVYEIIKFSQISDAKLNEVLDENADEETKEEIATVREKANQSSLADMTIFPIIMLVAYVILIGYFKSRGGYQAEVLTGHAAEDAEFTGGVEGPADM